MNEDQFKEEVEKFCEMLMDYYGWLSWAHKRFSQPVRGDTDGDEIKGRL